MDQLPQDNKDLEVIAGLQELSSVWAPLIKDIVDIERKNRDIAEQQVQVQDNESQRQYDAYMTRLSAEKDLADKRIALQKMVFFCIFGFVAATVMFVLGMTFFGDADQSAAATNFLTIILAGLGGYGVITVLSLFWKKLTQSNGSGG